MRFNIDLRRKTYDTGEGRRRLYQVADVKIVLRGPNPDLVNTPIGPVFTTLELDRRTLVLTDQTHLPQQGTSRTITYQCEMMPKIDFRADRAF